MPKKINLLHQRFGSLVVIEETSERKNRSIVWKCQCDCGNIQNFSTKELRSDGIIQCSKCGNQRQPKTNIKENIINKRFGHLQVLEKTNESNREGILYKCQCDCGNIVLKTRKALADNPNISCGCARLKYKIGDIINNKKILDIQQNTTTNNRHYYKVQCLLCGRIYEALTQTLEQTVGCGCQSSKGEFIISQILQANNISYIAQYHPQIKDIPQIRYDFALLDEQNKIYRLIEFDGEQHYVNNIKNTGWNTVEHFKKTHKNDVLKNSISNQLQIPLVRIPYWERANLSLEMLLGDQYLVT